MKYLLIIAVFLFGCKKEQKIGQTNYSYKVEINSSKALITFMDSVFESAGYATTYTIKRNSTQGVSVTILTNQNKDFVSKVVIYRNDVKVFERQDYLPLAATATKLEYNYKP